MSKNLIWDSKSSTIDYAPKTGERLKFSISNNNFG